MKHKFSLVVAHESCFRNLITYWSNRCSRFGYSFFLYSTIEMATTTVKDIEICLINILPWTLQRRPIQNSSNFVSCTPKHVQYWYWPVQEFLPSLVSQHSEEAVVSGDNSMLRFVDIFYSMQSLRFGRIGSCYTWGFCAITIIGLGVLSLSTRTCSNKTTK